MKLLNKILSIFISKKGRLEECFEPTISQKRAREIMGRNFFGIKEVIKYFGINPTRKQLASFSEIPFSEVMLKELKDTHVLIAVFPLSIFEICRKVEHKLFYGYEDGWYIKESFIKKRGKASWQLICKTPVESSTSKIWQEQKMLLENNNEEVPTIRVMVYTIISYYFVTGERLLENIYVRTSSCCYGVRIGVGYFGSSGISIVLCGDGIDRLIVGRVGVLFAKKF